MNAISAILLLSIMLHRARQLGSPEVYSNCELSSSIERVSMHINRLDKCVEVLYMNC